MGRRVLVLASVAFALLCTEAAAQTASEKGPAYLVFAGPYSSSPSSAFGHLFLALADDPGQAPPLWDVVTFNAETFDADPFRYVTVGILGGFLGRYSRVSFHEKTRDYGVLDDRDLWLVELRLTAEERVALEAALARREDAWFPYTFFSRNCAYYLQLLLAEATGAVPMPSGAVSPTGVFDEVRSTRLGGATYVRPAASRRLRERSAAMRPSVMDRLQEEPWTELAADTAWQGRLGTTERRLVQEVFALKAARRRTGIPLEAHDGMAHLRSSAVRAGARPESAADFRERGEPETIAPFHRYTRLRVGQGRDGAGRDRTTLALRGAMHGEADPWEGHQPINTMKLLGLVLSTRTDRLEPRVESVVVLSQRALRAGDWIRARSSWMLELQGRRGGLFSEDGFHVELRSGGGRTVRLPLGLHAYGLLTVAGVAQGGEGAALAPGLEAGLVALTFDRWRWGMRWTTERSLGAWSKRHTRARIWARVDTGDYGGLVAEYRRTPAGEAWAVGVDWYP